MSGQFGAVFGVMSMGVGGPLSGSDEPSAWKVDSPPKRFIRGLSQRHQEVAALFLEHGQGLIETCPGKFGLYLGVEPVDRVIAADRPDFPLPSGGQLAQTVGRQGFPLGEMNQQAGCRQLSGDRHIFQSPDVCPFQLQKQMRSFGGETGQQFRSLL